MSVICVHKFAGVLFFGYSDKVDFPSSLSIKNYLLKPLCFAAVGFEKELCVLTPPQISSIPEEASSPEEVLDLVLGAVSPRRRSARSSVLFLWGGDFYSGFAGAGGRFVEAVSFGAVCSSFFFSASILAAAISSKEENPLIMVRDSLLKARPSGSFGFMVLSQEEVMNISYQ